MDFPQSIETIKRNIKQAARAWEYYNNSRGAVSDNSDIYYNKAAKVAQAEAQKWGFSVSLDTGVGLYPTFEIVNFETGAHYTEYDAEGFYKRITGFWH